MRFNTITMCVVLISTAGCTAQSDLDDANHRINSMQTELNNANTKLRQLQEFQEENKNLKEQLTEANRPEPPLKLSVLGPYSNAGDGFIKLSNCSAADINFSISIVRPSEGNSAANLEHLFKFQLGGHATVYLDKLIKWTFLSGDQITINKQNGYKNVRLVLP